MKVLVACEESQEVCKAFRALGHEAYSCDIQEPSGGHPEWHILGDALKAIEGGSVTTMDGKQHEIGKWDLLIAHPPCTFLTISGNRWFNVERYGDRAVERLKARKEAAEFFMAFINADIPCVCVENPVGYMSTHYRKPDCIVQPYEFGHHARKKTCLWLKNLPPLIPTDVVSPGEILLGGYSVGASANYATDENGKILRWNDPRTAKARSKTFPGIAKAMAEQWGGDIREDATLGPRWTEVIPMKQVDIFRLAVKLLRKMAKENPGKSFTNSAGERATIDDVANELDKVSKWLYKDFHAEDIDRVIRCKNCIYYKKYRRKGAYKTVPFMACSKDMKKRDPTFFCKDGVRE